MNITEFKPIPNEALIDVLEELLIEAHTGDLQAIAYALSYADKCTGNGWAGTGKNTMSIIAEVEVLKVELIKERVDFRDTEFNP